MVKVQVCPVETTMNLIGGKWKVLIIKVLAGGKQRYGVLKSNITGISAKVLTAQLNEMIDDHLIKKTIYPEVPPRTEYELTPVGITLLPIIRSMKDWGSDFKKNLIDGKLEEFAHARISKMGTLCKDECATCEDREVCQQYRTKVLTLPTSMPSTGTDNR